MAPRSGHVSTTSPAVTQSNSHGSVTILASYWVSDEVPLIHCPRHMEQRPYLFRRVLFCHDARTCAAAVDVTVCMLWSCTVACAAWTEWSEDTISRSS